MVSLCSQAQTDILVDWHKKCDFPNPAIPAKSMKFLTTLMLRALIVFLWIPVWRCWSPSVLFAMKQETRGLTGRRCLWKAERRAGWRSCFIRCSLKVIELLLDAIKIPELCYKYLKCVSLPVFSELRLAECFYLIMLVLCEAVWVVITVQSESKMLRSLQILC